MTAPASVRPTASDRARELREANAGRTVAALIGLFLTLPLDLTLVGAAVGTRLVNRTPRPAPVNPRTVLITGGKMTKALQLARLFHAAGHRVVLVESPRYRFTGHRFSSSVDVFDCVPEVGEPGRIDALLEIARREHVDVFVPVSSPAASGEDAEAGRLLGEFCDVLHADVDTVKMLDDKAEFSRVAQSLGLRVPDWHRITDARQIEEFDFPGDRAYILKRIAYNPVGRMDLTKLSRATPAANAKFARSLSISAEDPWILQQFVAGREYCTHGTVRDGRLQAYGCSRSSAFQINYESVDKPQIRSWVEQFVSALRITGQASFDFIESYDGKVYAIECNPRTHSAITMFYNHSQVASAYLEARDDTITPRPDARPTHWIYHEVWRLLVQRGSRLGRLGVIIGGKDAIFSWRDPLPYLMVHHLQIPILLLANLRDRRGWTRIDFNIGKLVEMGGD